MNREWHAEHALGSKAPLDARVAWHREHAQVCACRPVPASLRPLLSTPTPTPVAPPTPA